MKTFRVGPDSFTGWMLAAAVMFFGAAGAAAQQSQQSAADAAKRARAEKKPPAKASRVFTTDTVVEIGIGAAGEGEAAAAATGEGGASSAASGETGATSGAASEKEAARSQNDAELNSEKQRLVQLQSELDLLQRDSGLKRQQFYNSPDYANNSAGKAELDALESQIAAKKDEIAASAQRIASLESKSKYIGAKLGPQREAPLTEDGQRSAWAGRMRPLRDELARIEAEIAGARQSASAEAANPSTTNGGSFTMTANQITQLERRRADVQQRIAALEDDARRAGIPPAWLR